MSMNKKISGLVTAIRGGVHVVFPHMNTYQKAEWLIPSRRTILSNNHTAFVDIKHEYKTPKCK